MAAKKDQVRWTNATLQQALTFHRDHNNGLMKNSSLGVWCGALDKQEETRAKILTHFREKLGQFFHHCFYCAFFTACT